MRNTLPGLAGIALLLAASTAGASAQTTSGTAFPGIPPGQSPATPPSSLAPATTGSAPTIVNQPGVPNTSTPGLIGTGTTASGLPGDSSHHPGYPRRGLSSSH